MASGTSNRRVNSNRRRNGASAEAAVSTAPRSRQNLKENNQKAGKGRVRIVGGRYIVFLTVICIVTFMLCIFYLQQKSALTTKYEHMATLQARYNTLKNDNDARYNQVISSVTLEDVKNAAINRLGMHYPDSEHMRYYTLTDDSYVRQYTDVSTGQ